MSKISLSIIVLNYNTSKVTLDCLQSLESHLDSSFEVIVLDNGSNDDFYQTAKKKYLNNKQFSIIRSNKNLGFGGGNNLAVEKSKGDYLLFLNSDTLIDSDAITYSLKYIFSHQDIVAVSCSLRNLDNTLQVNVGYFPTVSRVFLWQTFLDDLPLISSLIKSIHPHGSNFNFLNKFFKGFSLYSDKSSKAETTIERDWLTGAFLMVAKSDFQSAGCFDPSIFMYAEELELCFRLRKTNKKLVVLGNQSIVHIGGVSSGSTLAIAGEVKGMLHFFKKHYPNSVGLVKIIFFIGSLLRLLIFGIIRNNAKARDAYKQVLRNIT